MKSDTTKYIIHSKIKAEGVIEKSDVVGAIFGQTEGLLGSDLDLRELQKSGRIGRIEVNIRSNAGKSTGTIDIPSSLDKVETAVLAASLETIDRIGPCIAVITTKNVEDVRSSKRSQVIERAKQILTEMFDNSVPESQEITEEVKKAVRVEEITFYGKNNIPAGPNVVDSDAILVVEGRADVLNLLKHGIKNAIAVGGTNVPQEVIELCKNKTVTAFTDGDRGGELIIKELLQVADIDFIARAPDGKGVEELTQKEVVKALRQKMPVEQALEYYRIGKKQRIAVNQRKKENGYEERESLLNKLKVEEDKPTVNIEQSTVNTHVEAKGKTEIEPETLETEPKTGQAKVEHEFQEHVNQLKGTLSARLLDTDRNVVKEVAVRDLASTLKDTNGDVRNIVFDGVITQRLLDIAADRGIETIIGAKIGPVIKKPANINIKAAFFQ